VAPKAFKEILFFRHVKNSHRFRLTLSLSFGYFSIKNCGKILVGA
jgi:hypothetical protein